MASSGSQINVSKTLARLPVSDTTAPDNVTDYGVENTDIKTAPGVTLSDTQKLLTGSVLDLFAGRPSVKKLSLWTDDAKFEDPFTNAEGRKQYSAQWYGLAAAFSEIERLSHQVTSSGNPITMDLRTRYVVKGLGKEQTIDSVVKIHTDEEKIIKVEDRWNDRLPDGAFTNVRIINPSSWLHHIESWLWWTWSFVWDTRAWKAMRNLNSMVVPAFVSVPKSEEEEAAKKKV